MLYKTMKMKLFATKSSVLLVFSVLSMTIYGQNNTDEKSQNRELKQIKTESSLTQKSKKSEKYVQTVSIGERRSTPTKEDSITAIKSHIEAIDTKVAFVNADKKLKKQAEEELWFEQMQTIREELKLELKLLNDED
jgi:hypothetical protein